jgi:hypothetical protein
MEFSWTTGGLLHIHLICCVALTVISTSTGSSAPNLSNTSSNTYAKAQIEPLWLLIATAMLPSIMMNHGLHWTQGKHLLYFAIQIKMIDTLALLKAHGSSSANQYKTKVIQSFGCR